MLHCELAAVGETPALCTYHNAHDAGVHRHVDFEMSIREGGMLYGDERERHLFSAVRSRRRLRACRVVTVKSHKRVLSLASFMIRKSI